MGMPLKVITGLFGNRFSLVHPAPLPKRSYVFTNNPRLKTEVEKKGWIYVYVNKELTNDYQISSLQSKYIKFLRVLHDYPKIFKGTSRLLYVDHKFKLNRKHIHTLNQIPNPGIIIRTTPKLKTSVHHEFKASLRQPRYKKTASQTSNWIKKKLKKGYRAQHRVCNTGLMLYDLKCPKVESLTKEVYEAVCMTANPCCQIFWTILSQKYEDIIKTISYNSLPMYKTRKKRGRRRPKTFNRISV